MTAKTRGAGANVSFLRELQTTLGLTALPRDEIRDASDFVALLSLTQEQVTLFCPQARAIYDQRKAEADASSWLGQNVDSLLEQTRSLEYSCGYGGGLLHRDGRLAEWYCDKVLVPAYLVELSLRAVRQ